MALTTILQVGVISLQVDLDALIAARRVETGVTVIDATATAQTLTSFAAAPSSITVGAPITCTVLCANATSVTMNDGTGAVTVPLTGPIGAQVATKVYFPIANTTYTLKVKGSAADITATAAVTVAAVVVDTTAPNTSIVSGPASTTTATTATFTFSGTDNAPGALTFEVSLDGSTYTPATSPKVYTGLALGSHTFLVRARDVAGNVDASPATQTWTVAAPVLTAATWAKLTSGTIVAPDVRRGPAMTQGWAKSQIIPATGDIFFAQFKPTDETRGNFFYRAATNVWERTNNNVADWKKSLGGNENWGICYDVARARFYKSQGSPIGFSTISNPPDVNDPTKSPQAGDMVYDVATDNWLTTYKNLTTTYVSPGSDAAYYDIGPGAVRGPLGGVDCLYHYRLSNDSIYKFGGHAGYDAQRRVVATGVITTLTGTGPPLVDNSAKWTLNRRSGFWVAQNKFWCLADGCELYTRGVLDGDSWTLVATTGVKPATPVPEVYSSIPSYNKTDHGIVAALDESASAGGVLVVWASTNSQTNNEGTTSVQQTWGLDMTTLVWSQGPGAATGDLVPPGSRFTNQAVQVDLHYDPAHSRCVLLLAGSDGAAEVWAISGWAGGTPPGPIIVPPPPAPGSIGTITSVPLPALVGYPFSTQGSSKEVNQCYAPIDGRIYIQGGDYPSSATDGTYSVSLATMNDWRQDNATIPTYPSDPAPHALQDGAGMEWNAATNRIMTWPGAYGPYDGNRGFSNPPVAGDFVTWPLLNYSQGLWNYNPLTHLYAQNLNLFPWGTTPGAPTNLSGNFFGGFYDEVNNVVGACDSDNARVRTWLLVAPYTVTDVAITVTGLPEAGSTYFRQSRCVKIGRKVYVIGFSNDGGTVHVMRFWSYHLDTHAFTELARPPVATGGGTTLGYIGQLMMQLLTSNGYVVWPIQNSPIGEIYGIAVYNPATNTWAIDNQVPTYGNFIGNSFVNIPDGRIGFSGGVVGLGGRQMTHYWFYKVN